MMDLAGRTRGRGAAVCVYDDQRQRQADGDPGRDSPWTVCSPTSTSSASTRRWPSTARSRPRAPTTATALSERRQGRDRPSDGRRLQEETHVRHVTLARGQGVQVATDRRHGEVLLRSTNMREAIEASGAEIVTVAVRRVSLPGRASRSSTTSTPSATRCCPTPRAATPRTRPSAPATWPARRGSASMVKLEVIGDSRTLFPDAIGLLEATRTLAREGFIVLPYTQRRSGHGQEARGRRARPRDAAGRAHRLRPRHPQPVQHQDHPRDGHRARSSSTPAWAPRPTRPSPWSWAATACS